VTPDERALVEIERRRLRALVDVDLVTAGGDGRWRVIWSQATEIDF
jgi:hypothetical protein